LILLNPRSLAGQRKGAVVDRPFPGEGITGGEGIGVGKQEGNQAHL
jgi:hypothetical protein